VKKKIIVSLSVVVLIFAAFVGYMYIGMIRKMNNSDPTYWRKDIQQIEARYTEGYPDVDIVFIGSSSIRKWETLKSDFAPYMVVNHGFGGSKVADSTYYYDRLVTPFKPEAIVIFSGTNDIHGMTKTSKNGEDVYRLFTEFYEKSRNELPSVPVYYISISPTKARWKVWKDAEKANELIKEYAQGKVGLTFIDTTEALLKGGEPNPDILQKDGLHLNEKGYGLWTSIINPIVTKQLKK